MMLITTVLLFNQFFTFWTHIFYSNTFSAISLIFQYPTHFPITIYRGFYTLFIYIREPTHISTQFYCYSL